MARRSFSSFSPPSFPVRSSLLSPFCFSAHLSPPSPSFSPRQLHLPPSALTTTACRFSSLRGPPPSFCYFCSASSLSSSSSSLGRWKDSLFVSSCSSPFSRRSFIPDIPSPRRSHPPSSSVSSCSSSSSSLSSSSSSLSSSSSSSSLSSLTFSFPLFPSRRFFTKAHLQRRSDDALPCLRVMTYNILHKLDARRAKFFSYSQPANLQSETRLARVRDELRDLQPHVACLQEVERESLSHLTSQLECDAYACAASLFNDKSGVSDGCALLYKKSILEVVRTHAFHFASLVDDFFPNQKAARDHMALAFWRRLKEKRNLAVVASFRVKATGQIVHVCSTHLFWDPRQPEVKLMQAFLLARALRRYADEQERTREEEREEKIPECTQRNDTDAGDERVTKEETNESRNEATTRKVNVKTGEWTREEVPETDQKINHEINHEIKQAREQEREQGREERSSAGLVRDAPLIVGGDFNSMPFQSVTKVSGPEGREKGKEMCVENKYHSGVYQLFTEGLVLPSHPEHPVSFHPSLAADAVPPLTIFPFQSAYKEVLGEEPRFTNYTRDFQGCLDYLFFRNATVKAVLSIPDDCELKREVALPNSRFPSDHVALMADFVLR